ncbi:hypothetical protein [Nocardia sp. NPDC057455]|uniref:hypothetical protein n=1 Tax=Nocardia sp. NPDC057455 TaxID=3346138 RepID=UPI00367180A8
MIPTTDSTSLPEVLAVATASFLAGWIVGRFVRFRRVPGGLRPEIVRNPFREWLQGRGFRLLLIVLFVVSTGLIVQFTITQRGCNSEFRRTIIERADIAADDNRARRSADAARRENDVAVGDLVEALLEIPQGPEGRDQPRRLMTDFRTRYAANIARQDADQARQESNESRRSANPYPNC